MQKHPGLLVAIGVGKKPTPDSGPSPFKGAPDAPPTADPMGGGDDETSEVGSISPEEVDYSANDLCETCSNMGDDGSCTKYHFPVDKTGHCEAGYEPKGGGMGADMSSAGDDAGAGSGDYGQ